LANFLKRYKPEKAFIFGATPPRMDVPTFRLPIFSAGVFDVQK
jgi:hypothetical protein